MAELVEQMKEAGMSDEEIEIGKYFRPTLFHDCVERIVPPPRILYWRVRAVFALYGGMKDSKTKAPLFNERAWKKANNVLREILSGYYSDPPGVPMYRKKIGIDGSVMKNKYDMDVIDCMRGTNRTEAVHKGLVSTFGGWNMGVEMSSYVIAWYRSHFINSQTYTTHGCLPIPAWIRPIQLLMLRAYVPGFAQTQPQGKCVDVALPASTTPIDARRRGSEAP